MKRALTLLLIGAVAWVNLSSFRSAGSARAEKVKWLTVEEAYKLQQKEPRKWLVDLYTDWCGWCKVMDRETYTDSKVAEYINKNFYAVKFDAEQRGPVKIGNQTYKFVSQGSKGVHELAVALTNNQLSYPTTVFMTDKMELIQPVPGFHKAKEFHQIVTFFGGNYYQNTSYEKYVGETYAKLFAR